MGAGASTNSIVTPELESLTGKPLDASDITDLGVAKREISEWRVCADRMMREHNIKAPKKAGPRRAVMANKNEEIPSDFMKPKIPKVDEVKNLITKAARENLLFKSCQDDDWEDFVNAFQFANKSAGDEVIKQGDEGDLFYIVEAGTLDVFLTPSGAQNEIKVSTLGPGTAFGDLALMYNQPRAATIRCTSECKLWTIDRQTFKSIKTLNQRERIQEHVAFLSKVTIGEEKNVLGDLMNKSELVKIASVMDIERFNPGEYIIRQGQMGDHFYILLDGEVSVHIHAPDGQAPGEKKATLSKGAFFGEKALINEDKRAASIIADSNVRVLALDREDFIVMFGSMKEFTSKDKKAGNTREIATAKTTTTSTLQIERTDLDDITILGCGAFGKVLLVKDKRNGETYALKCQGKKSIVENGLQDHVVNEARVMAELDHPFIIKLYATMVDTQYIYFVMELLLGGEIFTHLRKLGSFEESWTRFYSGSVLAAFAIMHQKGMAYRDLKPENLVLDDKGYCKMVDFGLAKHIVDGKAWTLCGTPDYLAPEIILNEGHNIAVDYWALGVLIYEMVCGVPPFYAEEAMEIYERILNGTVPIPSSFSKSMGDMVRKLLKQQQTKRLGVTKGGTLAVMKHKWYSGFDWDGLIQRKLNVPILPQVKSREDHSNFESFTSDFEEVEDCPEWNPEF